MQIFKEGVEYFRPRNFDQIDPDKERQFFKYAGSMRQVMIALAPYQSATFRSILLSQPAAESQRDRSAAERLIQFFDSLAESAAFERQQRKQKVPAEPKPIEGTLVANRS